MNKERLDKLLHSVSKNMQERIKKIVHVKDVYRTFIGELLVRFIIFKQYGYIGNELKFDKNIYGKPFLCGFPFFHYNIAHSGEWVVCATYNKEIGVDVEEILPFDVQLAKGMFTEEEYLSLFNMKKEGNVGFYDLWTLKESYVKAKGMGLSIPLDSFNVKIHNNNNIKLTDIVTGKSITDFICKQYKIDNQYRLSVCTNHDDINEFEELPILVSFNYICSDLGISLFK